MLTGIRRPFWGQVFEASASGIWLLAVQNTVPELLRIGSILSVCLFVCATFCRPLFGAGRWTYNSVFRKKSLQKRELEPNSVGEADHFHATLPRSLHSPQVATAAPPSPSAQLVASQLKHAPEAPPAPAGSILVIRSVNDTLSLS